MTKTLGPEGQAAEFLKHFSSLKDPRRTTKGNLQHLLSDIIILTVSAIMCGADNWELVEVFGKNQLDWLKSRGNFSNGIPSSDTLGRVFALLDPKSFNACFINWIESIREHSHGEVVAVDGKSIRGANPKKNGGKMPHIVSAFASTNGVTLGQVKVDEKSNEITAIPKLLDLLFLEGCTVTIDAMGCQTDIASKIIEKQADYILAVKGNQGNLEQAIADTVLFEKPETSSVQEDFGHGRIESRTCYAYSELGHIEGYEKWGGLKSIVKIETETYEKVSGKTTKEQRYYISSLPPDAKVLNSNIRKHWSVENNLHWTLDVEFGEDRSRKRTRNAAENHNIVLKMVMTMLAMDNSKKTSKRSKRLKAALDPKYRDKLWGF
jgi:predicted transposase YbfD/YdcC